MTLGVIVTYNPNIIDLKKNLIAIQSQLDKLVLYDNASENISEINTLCTEINIICIKSDRNIGLGAAYNFVINMYRSDFDYLITFDQDTFLKSDTIEKLLELFKVDVNVGIVGPSFSKREKFYKREYSQVDYLIQSCCIFSKEVIAKVGFFNEKLFIDSVDFEYCLRALISKFKIFKSNTVFIDHNLGVLKKRFGLSYIQHNVLRNYYISRNHKYLTIKYLKVFPYFIIRKNLFFIIHIFKLLFLDQDLKKIQSIVKGLRDNVN